MIDAMPASLPWQCQGLGAFLELKVLASDGTILPGTRAHGFMMFHQPTGARMSVFVFHPRFLGGRSCGLLFGGYRQGLESVTHA